MFFSYIFVIKSKKISNFNSLICDKYYINHKKYFDTGNRNIFTDNDIRENFFPNFYNIYKSIDMRDCIFDIGSNIGEVTEIFHKFYPKNRFFLAEPLQLNCEVTNKKFNQTNNLILIVNTAIGFKKQTIKWKYNKAGNMLIKTRSLYTSNVSFMNLDSYYNEYARRGNVFFLKIDVEGYEDEVLFSGKALLSKGLVKILYLEYHFYCKTKSSFLVLYLEKLGYNCYLVGKYKIIKITSGCLFEIDSHKYSHILCINNNFEKEYEFIDSYNKLSTNIK